MVDAFSAVRLELEACMRATVWRRFDKGAPERGRRSSLEEDGWVWDPRLCVSRRVGLHKVPVRG